MDPNTLKTLIDYGILGVALIVVWKALQAKEARLLKMVQESEARYDADKQALVDRVHHLEDYCRGKLEQIGENCTSALHEAARAVNRMCDQLDEDTKRHDALDRRDHA